MALVLRGQQMGVEVAEEAEEEEEEAETVAVASSLFAVGFASALARGWALESGDSRVDFDAAMQQR